ncbi:MAG TPA: branched-chain amino acid transaminase [Anaerolineaceae bacterium]
MASPIKYIWMNGELVPPEKAVVSFLNPTLHYGPGAFEGIRCYDTDRGPAIFRLKEHTERLIGSYKVLGGRELPYTFDEIYEATKEVVRANGFKECYIRPLIYFTDSMGLTLDAYKTALGIAAWEWGNFLGAEGIEKGVRAKISSYTRHHINVSMTKAKIPGNYVNSILAKAESTRMGFEEAIMLDPQGYVAECTGENIFYVRKGMIYTPPLATVLEGITRDTLLAVAGSLGYIVVEEPVGRDQLYLADEVFVCGTAAEVIAIREIDFRIIGDGKMGPVTRALQQAYFDVVHGKHALSDGWCDYLS